MTVRKWQMVRLSTGDYLLPGNDREVVFRIRRYTDGPSGGLDLPRDRDFWAVWRSNSALENFDESDLEFFPEGWVQLDDMLDTRQQAIESALHWEAHRNDPKPAPRKLDRPIGAYLATDPATPGGQA